MEFAVEEIPFLQEVYRPNRGQRPEIDLVFVHGLNPFSNQNHAYDTWTHQNGRCWLYHFLPDDIPEARIWIFGYNSNVATDVSEARIKDHADVLLDRLQQKRKEGRRHGDIPIIFVGHSLGGLVIKQALLNARDNSFFNPVSKSTYGLVFFGTPHQGGRGGAFGSLAARIAKFVSADRADNDLLECLKANSLFTQEASERFSHQLENYKVISFFETKPMKLGVRGISEIVVDRQSAVLNLGGSRERREALNADHSAMCKIGQKGPIYDGIVGKIRDMVDEALDWYDGSNNIFLSPDVAGRGRSSSTGRSPSGKSRDSSPRFLQQPRESAATGSPAPPTLPSRSNSNSAAYSARVIYAYVPAVQDVNDLELTPGDLITNIDTRGEASDQGWWFGYNSNGESGLFPSNFVEMQRSPSGLEFKQSRPALPASEQWSTTSLPTAERVSSPPGTGARPTARNVGNSLSEANLSVTDRKSVV